MVYPSLNHFVFGSAIIVMAEAPVPSLSDNESQGSFDGMMAWLYLMWLGVSSMIVLSFKKQRSRENALTQMLDAYNLDRDPVTRPFGQYASRMAYMESISFWASPYR